METCPLVTIAVAILALGTGVFLQLRPDDWRGNGPEPERTSSARRPQWTGPQPREVAEQFTRAGTSATINLILATSPQEG